MHPTSVCVERELLVGGRLMELPKNGHRNLSRVAESTGSSVVGTSATSPIITGHPVPQDIDPDVEAEWELLFPALKQAQVGRVLVLTNFRRFKSVGLLPFHIHVQQPDAVPWLPLTATVTVIPFEHTTLDLARYQVANASKIRNAARRARLDESRDLPDDFVWPDWEDGVQRNRRRLQKLFLPPHSFVRVEHVMADGRTRHVPRPVLGKYASRNAPKPRVFTPSKGALSQKATRVLSDVDLLVVDLQRLRGKRTLRLVGSVLDERPLNRPTLITACSPSDVFAAGLEDKISTVVITGKPPCLKVLHVKTFGYDRLAADKRFESSLEGLSGQGPQVDDLIARSRSAWWAIHQSVHDEGGSRELQVFEQGLANLEHSDPPTASLFTACHDILNIAMRDQEVRVSRLKTIIDVVVGSKGSGPILVLTRGAQDAAAVRSSVAAELSLQESDLEDLGVWIRPAYHHDFLGVTPEVVIATAYTGMKMLDVILASGAGIGVAIFDPVEARTAWYHAQRMAHYLSRVGATALSNALSFVIDGLAPFAIGFADSRDILFSEDTLGSTTRITTQHTQANPGEAIVCLVDGTCLHVHPTTRFEVLGHHGNSSRTASVAELEPGDQIILLDDEVQAEFSERRIALLDSGPLLSESQARATWLMLVREVARAKNLNPPQIARLMTQQGFAVTPTTVRTWLRDDPMEALAPNSQEGFEALANALGLPLPPETLYYYYEKIHQWRVRHRKAGHEVAQAIRLAYTGRLGPATLARIERVWGVGVRELVTAARVGVVDEVILPEVGQNA